MQLDVIVVGDHPRPRLVAQQLGHHGQLLTNAGLGKGSGRHKRGRRDSKEKQNKRGNGETRSKTEGKLIMS
jgi:hypothetical protein